MKVLFLVTTCLLSQILLAAPLASLEQRVQGLEQAISSPAHINAIKKIDSMQQEILELKGQLELQDHIIKQLQNEQKTLYLDLENKISAANHHDIKPSPKSGIHVIVPPVVSGTSELELEKLDEAALYQKAFDLIKHKQFDKAKIKLNNLLEGFPQGKYLVNAHYWLGEILMFEWQSDKAKTELLLQSQQEFILITKEFPHLTKCADALLKLGLIEIELQNFPQARQYLNEVLEKFEDSPAARIAGIKIKSLINKH